MRQGPLSASFLLKIWGEEGVVYDAASGDTHYLKPLTLALYQLSREHPAYPLPDLTAALAERLGAANTAQFQEEVEDTFNSLRKIGLLESA
jgi:PqqD family protein of HPr-rel-A system